MSIKQSPKKRLKKGLLIAIEGIDGSGKTTQAKLLVDYLRSQGYDSLYLCEPTEGKYGKKIRKHAKTRRVSAEEEFRLFLQDRKEDVEKNILPALLRGKIVVIDRYYYSSMAYQGARGVDPEMIRKENEKIAPRADLVIYLKLPVRKSCERITKKRASLLDQFETAEYQHQVARIYDQMSKSLPEFYTINAAKDIETVHKKVLRKIKILLFAN